MIRIPAILFVLLMLAGCSSQKQDSEQSSSHELTGNIEIENPWARPGSAAGNSAGYLTIYNGTEESQILSDIKSPAASAELHESYEKENYSGMRPAENLTIASGDSLKLKPGGYHIMFMEINNDWETGDSLKVFLNFSKADSVEITLPIKNSPDD